MTLVCSMSWHHADSGGAQLLSKALALLSGTEDFSHLLLIPTSSILTCLRMLIVELRYAPWTGNELLNGLCIAREPRPSHW